jgi:membrane protein DedA with SNARE-associated domain
VVESTNAEGADFRSEQIARLTVLELLYTRRRTEPQKPTTILDVEALTGRAREHLEFSIWFLTQKKFVVRGDDSGLTITADGVEYLENNVDGTVQKPAAARQKRVVAPRPRASASAPTTLRARMLCLPIGLSRRVPRCAGRRSDPRGGTAGVDAHGVHARELDLNPWMVLAVGVPGSALGRYLFSLYIPKFSDRMIARKKNEELRYVGKRLERHWWQTWLFVFGYTLLPLSTTALFTAAAMTKVPMLRIIPAFMAGKFLSDAMMVAAGRYAADAIKDPLQGIFGWKSLTTAAVTLLITAAFLFVDWHALVAKKFAELQRGTATTAGLISTTT